MADERGQELEQTQSELAVLRAEKQVVDAKLASAMTQIAEYEKRLFGRSTERVVPVDRELRQSDADVADAADAESNPAPKDDAQGAAKTKRNSKTRRPDDAPGLRNETVEHPVSEATRRCPHCGAMAEPIGTGKFTTEWDYIPGYFVRRRHIQEVVACRCGQHIARAEAPLRVFDRTQFGPGLIAYLIVSKCGDAMPIYRAEKHFARLGVPIARSNASESALRIIALARENTLFFGHEQAARNYSVLYSLVQTAERNGINALDYLQDVLVRVQTHPVSRIEELLPDRWKPA